MNFKQTNPSPSLSQFVKSFWILEKDYSKTGEVEIVYPDGCLNLIFSFSGNNVTSFFTGQQTEAIKIEQVGMVKFIAVEFFPYGAFPFFNIAINEFTNLVISPTDIYGNSFIELQEKLGMASDEVGIQLIEAFLIDKLRVHKMNVEQSKKATQLLYLNNGNLRIDQLAIALNMTKRTLERKFEMVTGLSPKAMAKIFRFNKVKNELMLDPLTSLTSLAYKYHYFDQSHFIHDFKQITGHSPSSFSREVMERQIYFSGR